ncbi:hypothetical protein GCM10010222_36390 [Streptomyces tanashiensis]|nr:hypothetical protein GCM10010222_36390 [Streptomyces tanashiensis]
MLRERHGLINETDAGERHGGQARLGSWRPAPRPGTRQGRLGTYWAIPTRFVQPRPEGPHLTV